MHVDDSPNKLERPKVAASRISRWPMTAVIAVVVLLIVVLVNSVHKTSKKKPVAEDEQKKEVEASRLMTVEPGHGINAGKGSDLPDHVPGGLVGTRNPAPVTKPAPSQDDREFERFQQQRMQEYQAALKAPLAPKRIKQQATSTGQAAVPVLAGRENVRAGFADLLAGQQLQGMQGENPYNPAADKDKESFFSRSETKEWVSPYTREAGRMNEVKTGTVIPGMMITGINSDLPGPMIAQVSRDVYDTATGGQLLVPQGSKLFGVYDARVIFGQSRVLIAWNRIVFPDGSSVSLGAMPGADMGGYAGYTDVVNNHYLRIFGSAIMMSFITGGTSYAVDSMGNNGTDSNATTVQNALGAALAAQLNQTTLGLLQRNLNIKPTLEIRPGYQFNIIVTKDVVFGEAYRPYAIGAK